MLWQEEVLLNTTARLIVVNVMGNYLATEGLSLQQNGKFMFP